MLKLSYLYASYRANVSEMYHNNGNKKNRLIMKRSGSILRYFNAWYIKIQFSSYPGFNLWCSSFSDCWSNLTKPYWLYLLINFSIGNAKIIPSSLVTSLSEINPAYNEKIAAIISSTFAADETSCSSLLFWDLFFSANGNVEKIICCSLIILFFF